MWIYNINQVHFKVISFCIFRHCKPRILWCLKYTETAFILRVLESQRNWEDAALKDTWRVHLLCRTFSTLSPMGPTLRGRGRLWCDVKEASSLSYHMPISSLGRWGPSRWPLKAFPAQLLSAKASAALGSLLFCFMTSRFFLSSCLTSSRYFTLFSRRPITPPQSSTSSTLLSLLIIFYFPFLSFLLFLCVLFSVFLHSTNSDAFWEGEEIGRELKN